MEIFNRKKMNLYQTATLLFVLIFTSLENGVAGECVKNPDNIAVWEGTKDIYMECASNPDPFYWICYPTSDELEDNKIDDELGVVASDNKGLYNITERGLKILEATINEGRYRFSTAGICVGLHGNETRLFGFKVVVVRAGPVCTFDVSSPSNGVIVTLNCTVSYADHSVHPVRPHIEFKVGDVYIVSETIYPERINQYIFVGYKAVEIIYNACLPITVTLTFDPPTDISYPWMSTNAPAFINTYTFPATSTDCLREGSNIAVLAGTKNVVVGSSRPPQTMQRKVSPTSEPLKDNPISDFEKGIVSGMESYYSQDKSGLIILTATAVAGPNQQATAGIYTEKDRNGKQTRGLKVIVVLGPPQCSSNASDSNPPKTGDSVKLTCRAQFADHPLHQIPARITIKLNDVSRSTTSPSRTKTADETFIVTADFVVTYDPTAAYTCVLSFDPPPSDDGYDNFATNAPTFSASCRF